MPDAPYSIMSKVDKKLYKKIYNMVIEEDLEPSGRNGAIGEINTILYTAMLKSIINNKLLDVNKLFYKITKIIRERKAVERKMWEYNKTKGSQVHE